MRKFALPWLAAGLKPSFSAFRLLRTLGDERIPEAASDVLITKKKDGTLVLAAWNLADPGATVAAKSITFTLQGVKGNAAVSISRVDHEHGDVLAAYDKMGRLIIPPKSNCDSCEMWSGLDHRKSSTFMAAPSR
jgi:xylan 1,4-beta-xylosidase